VAGHEIVLASFAADSEPAVGDALCQVFEIPFEFARQIAKSAPIVIVSDLDPGQASSVLDAMASLTDAGGNLEISAASGESTAKLNWPAPPTVGGRSLDTYVRDR
jgi:hypothetical protein